MQEQEQEQKLEQKQKPEQKQKQKKQQQGFYAVQENPRHVDYAPDNVQHADCAEEK